MNPEISIIVSVFNMEKYLGECLESIMNQTFANWECIVIDDGSTDSSPAICDAYANKDHRFRIFHKENGGLSSARNTGLDAAKGEYIGFVDSDDWIEPEMYEHLFQIAKENDAELAMCGLYKEYIGHVSKKRLGGWQRIIDGPTTIREIGFDRLPNYVCNKLQKRSIINCRFPEGRNFEDIYVYAHWIRNVKKTVIAPRLLYHYRMRKGSIVHADQSRNRLDYFHSCLEMMKLAGKIKSEEGKDRVNVYINKAAVQAAKMVARKEQDIERRRDVISKLSMEVKDFPFPSLGSMGLKKWFRVFLLRNYPMAFAGMMRFVYMFDFGARRRDSRLYD